MTEPYQSEELQRLRVQLAELTRRVYRLEGLLAVRPPEAVDSALTAPVPLPPKIPAPVEPASETTRFPREPVPIASRQVPARATSTLANAAPTAKAPTRAASDASLESRIGGQWLNRIGIVAVLVGLSYFLKLAFENNWIGPATQVLIGIAAGVGILLWSERFRRKGYPGFAYSLKAVAVGALYLSLWAASQYYHLVPPTVTFLGMVLVTVTSAALSLRQNAELLAALALVGGFLTPVLVSTGENHEVALFCYLGLLDLGTIWIVAMKGWRPLLLGSFVGTGLLFAAWASGYYNESQLAVTLSFATFFFLLYAGAPFFHRGAHELRASQNVMIALALLNAGFYFATSYLMLEQHYRHELAWLSLAVAVFFFVLARALQRADDANGTLFAPLHLALGIGFLTIAIPLKLGGYWNTLGWIVEGGALFWAAHRGRSMLLRVLGTCALALGIARLTAVDVFDRGTLLINPRFGLYLAAIAALALLVYFTLEEAGEQNRQWAGGAIICINILVLVAMHFEIVQYFQPQFTQAYSDTARQNAATIRAFAYSAVWMIYGSGLILVGFWRRSAFLRWQALVLLALTVVKVFLFDIGTLERGYRIAAFIVLGAILLAVSFFYQRSRIKTAE